MKKINFENDVTKVNAETFNTFQNNIDEAVVPEGGYTGQVLTKSSNEDNEVTWTDPIETTVINSLNSESTTSALSAYQGKVLNNRLMNVEDLSTYSTEEKAVGTWIDGKPIYRKVISIGNLPNKSSVTINHNISNIENVINSSLIWYDSEDKCWWHDRRWDSATINIAYNVSPTFIWINGAGVNWGNRTQAAYAIVEYTKTTD